jgi:8-oxo-dGTP pyrophosphatase MutT (NUDIX family)
MNIGLCMGGGRQVKLGAFATVRDKVGRVLLAQRRTDDFWMQPGGGIEPGETPWQAVVREVREETGFDVTVERLIGIYCWPETSELIFSFLCALKGGAVRASDETRDVRFFPPDALPARTFAEHRERIADALASARDGGECILRTPTCRSAPEEVRRSRAQARDAI